MPSSTTKPAADAKIANITEPTQHMAPETENDMTEDGEVGDDTVIENEIKRVQGKGGRKVDCSGDGCGEPLCTSCWPQNESEWKAFEG